MRLWPQDTRPRCTEGRRGLAAGEQGFLEPLAQLAAQRVTLADLAERKG